MKCNRCGNEISENDLFCGECGTKIDITSHIDKKGNPVKKNGKKLIIALGITAVFLIVIISIFMFSGKPKEYDFEADELANIINTEDEKQYYEDTLNVHGYFYRHPSDENIFIICNNPNEENGIIFVCNSVDEELGDGSEITVSGTLGQLGERSDYTVLIGQKIDVDKKADRIFEVGSVDGLLENSNYYIGKRVCVIGSVEGVAGSIWIWNPMHDASIRLGGIIETVEYDAIDDWSMATIIGVFKLDRYGETVIEVEKVE